MAAREAVFGAVSEAQQILRAATEGPVPTRKVRAKLEQVVDAIERGLDDEETVLSVVLPQVDAWGPVRMERMLAAHAEARSVVKRLRELARMQRRTEARLAQAERALSELVRALQDDARVYVGGDVLKDDPVVAGQSDG
ncbi:MAG: hypothetical protein AB2A00_26660 [Myxococcota bacterium]